MSFGWVTVKPLSSPGCNFSAAAVWTDCQQVVAGMKQSSLGDSLTFELNP